MEQDVNSTTPVINKDKPNDKKGWKIATVIASILAVCSIGFGVYCLIENNNKTQEISNLKTQIEEQNRTIAELNEQDNNPQEDLHNKSYKVGDLVTLKNGTSWNVIKNSDIDDESVVLLSADDINASRNVKISEIKNYLLNEYKNSIAEQLASNVDVRLLTIDDVSELSGIASSSLVPGTSLENGITPDFLYETTTLISNDTNMLLGENPNMICEAVDASQFGSSDPGRICMSTQTNTEPFRVVITMAKKDI